MGTCCQREKKIETKSTQTELNFTEIKNIKISNTPITLVLPEHIKNKTYIKDSVT